jgi:sec-independent protein translocase protein TatA
MDLGWPEIILVLVIVVLLFGPGRIGKVAGELGQGIRNFRQGLENDDKSAADKKEAEKSPEAKQESEKENQAK